MGVPGWRRRGDGGLDDLDVAVCAAEAGGGVAEGGLFVAGGVGVFFFFLAPFVVVVVRGGHFEWLVG